MFAGLEAIRAATAAIADHVAGLVADGLSALLFSQVHRDQNSCDIVLFPEQVLNSKASADCLVERSALVVARTYHDRAATSTMASNIFMRNRPIAFLRVDDRYVTMLLSEHSSGLGRLFGGSQRYRLAEFKIALAADGLQPCGGGAIL